MSGPSVFESFIKYSRPLSPVWMASCQESTNMQKSNSESPVVNIDCIPTFFYDHTPLFIAFGLQNLLQKRAHSLSIRHVECIALVIVNIGIINNPTWKSNKSLDFISIERRV
eukprot:TRINITY_DN251_c0_g1_i1.p2 TRINITY_DN251_c0_g1~~TRINITY_DN251_c0_g1_i1.p2  ORF type:complete len:112 (-),score=12.68 TRINITY_DN251_c0_g1_i1:771-1106(-)